MPRTFSISRGQVCRTRHEAGATGASTVFLPSDGTTQSPIQGAVDRGSERQQPELGLHDWDDVITALFQNKMFLKMETVNYPVAGLGGRIKRY
jgi:hypothetical protein